MSQFKLFLGPMFSGKTSSLISEYNKCKMSDIKVVCFKPAIDNRYSKNNDSIETSIISHDGEKIPAFIVDKLSEEKLNNLIDKAELIIFDEIQFIENAVFLISKIFEKSKNVVAAGLNGDYKKKPFKYVSDIIPYATEIISKKANCKHCQNLTQFTKRKINIKKKWLIGSDDIYINICFKCSK